MTDEMDFLDDEAHRVSVFMGFLIQNPELATTLTGIDLDRNRALNIARLCLAEKWVETMKERLIQKYGKDYAKAYNTFKGMLEVCDTPQVPKDAVFGGERK